MTEKHGKIEHEIDDGVFIIEDATDISPEVEDAFEQAAEQRAARHRELIARYVIAADEELAPTDQGDEPAPHEDSTEP